MSLDLQGKRGFEDMTDPQNRAKGGMMEERTLYCGIDVSKASLDCALTVDGKKVLASKKVANTPGGFATLTRWFHGYREKKGCNRIHLCIESTGRYSASVAEYFEEQEGIWVSVVNPSLPRAFGKSLLLRTKTDAVSALLLAFYVATVKPEPNPRISPELKELRSLVRHLEYLISRRGEEKSHLESVVHEAVAASIREIIGQYDRQIEETQAKISSHIDQNPSLKEKVDLLTSIPGIASMTAQLLICELHGENGRGLLSAKRQTAHAGLAPRMRESGSSVHGKPHICKIGSKRLRKCLYLPAVVAIRYNPLIRSFYHRLREKGKPKMVALAACMRKLLVIAVGVLNNKTPFDEQWVPKLREAKQNV